MTLFYLVNNQFSMRRQDDSNQPVQFQSQHGSNERVYF